MVPPLDKIGGDRSAAGNTTVLPPFPTRSGIWGATENIYSLYSLRVLPPLTQSRLWQAAKGLFMRRQFCWLWTRAITPQGALGLAVICSLGAAVGWALSSVDRVLGRKWDQTKDQLGFW